MHKERLSWIDVCRGIGIILVLYGHGLSGNSYRHLIYAFHMPLFFFLSGIVFQHRKYDYIFSFLPKNVKNILYPYFFFAFLTFTLSLLQSKNSNFFSQSALWQFFGIFYGNGNEGRLAFNVVLWFLPCLFITKTIFASVTHFVTDKKWIIAILLLFSVTGYFFSLYLPKVKLPFGIETAINAVVFFGAGFLWNSKSEKLQNFFQKYAKTLFILSLLISITLAAISYEQFGTQIDMRQNRFHNYFLFYTAAFGGILSCVFLSMTIHKNKLLEYIGKHSLILFIWHLLVFSYISKFLRFFVHEETLRASRNTYLAPLYTITAIIIILLVSFLIKKLTQYMPSRYKNLIPRT